MMTAEGVVVAQGQGYVSVQCQQKSSCHSCVARKSCGTGMVTNAVPSRALELRIATEKQIAIGSSVSIGFPEPSMLRFAGLVYLVPLFTMIFGAMIGEKWAHHYQWHEGIVIFFAFGSMALGLGIARWWIRKMTKTQSLSPIILHIQP